MSKNIIVTGANGNLGSAIVKELIIKGHRVIGLISPRSNEPQDGAHYYKVDLSDEQDVKSAFDKIKAAHKTLSGAVFTVGGFAMSSIENSSMEDLDKMWSLNFKTAFLSAQAANQWLQKSDGGNLVFIGARQPVEGGGFGVLPYAIAKGAVIQLADIINEKANDTGVKASVVVPSVIDTPQNRESMPNEDFSKWVQPAEIAESVAFLLSNNSGALRDTVLKVYGES